jgi:hypothetical protein
MNLISQHRGNVKGYRVQNAENGFTVLLLKNDGEVTSFHCSTPYQVLATINAVGFKALSFTSELEKT